MGLGAGRVVDDGRQGARLDPRQLGPRRPDLTYQLIRNGGGSRSATTTVQSTYWSQPQVVLTDTQPAGSTPNYRIVAVDGDGNVANSADRFDRR